MSDSKTDKAGKVGSALWLSWEDHRRSRELSAHFGAVYRPLLLNGPRPIRYLVLGLRTLWIVLTRKCDTVFCQNPSIVLAALLCVVRSFSDFRLVVDRHSNFKLATKDSRELRWRMFHLLSHWTSRAADITIVTNETLALYVRSLGGRAVVLPDPLPELDHIAARPRPGSSHEPRVFVVCTFADDEPVEQIIEAAAALAGSAVFSLSGNPKRYLAKRAGSPVPLNVRFSGFLPYEDYLQEMASADLVVVLTTQADTLNCGAYEAVALGKPMILANHKAIRDYFAGGAVYSDCDSESIRAAISSALGSLPGLRDGCVALKGTLARDWVMLAHRASREISSRIGN